LSRIDNILDSAIYSIGSRTELFFWL